MKARWKEREFSRQWEELDPISRGQREDGVSGELRVTEHGYNVRGTPHELGLGDGEP